MFTQRLFAICLCLVCVGPGAAANEGAAQEDAGAQISTQNDAAKITESGMHDFDFLFGKWTILHKRLLKPLEGADEWNAFVTDFEAWPLLGGLANMDRLSGDVNGKPLEGYSIRTYDKDTGEWTIYWMDSWNPALREQVRGRFEDGVGVFYGEEAYQGRTYPMRFMWENATPDTARWEQAYRHPQSGAWETNWVMEFTKKTQ